MGYFNIFYKITRIIDFFTRKRNRKFVFALCLVGAIVFFSPNIVNADFGSTDSTNLYTIRTKVDSIKTEVDTISSYTSNFLPNIYTKLNNVDLNVDTISDYAPYIQTSYNELVAIYNELDSMKTTLESVEDISSDIHDELVSLNTEINDLLDKTNTMIIELNNIYDKLVEINTNIMHYGNLNHEDLLELKSLLEDYLYGNTDELNDINYDTFNSLQIGASYIVVQNNNFNINRIRIIKGHTYYITINNTSAVDRNCRYAFSTNKYNPYVGLDFSSEVNKGVLVVAANDSNTLEFSSLVDGYLYINTAKAQTPISSSQSDYNPGQDEGIYGGLTDIDSQVKSQGEQTRDTITSTDYNQSDVNINTDSVSNIDTSQTDGLFTTIFNNFNSAATGGVDSITIPLPHNSGNIVLYSNVVSSHLGNLSALVSAFWYFVFGLYAFKFVNNLLHNIKDGSILNGFRNNNEVITSDML